MAGYDLTSTLLARGKLFHDAAYQAQQQRDMAQQQESQRNHERGFQTVQQIASDRDAEFKRRLELLKLRATGLGQQNKPLMSMQGDMGPDANLEEQAGYESGLGGRSEKDAAQQAIADRIAAQINFKNQNREDSQEFKSNDAGKTRTSQEGQTKVRLAQSDTNNKRDNDTRRAVAAMRSGQHSSVSEGKMDPIAAILDKDINQALKEVDSAQKNLANPGGVKEPSMRLAHKQKVKAVYIQLLSGADPKRFPVEDQPYVKEAQDTERAFNKLHPKKGGSESSSSSSLTPAETLDAARKSSSLPSLDMDIDIDKFR